jgi:hypothetical protein
MSDRCSLTSSPRSHLLAEVSTTFVGLLDAVAHCWKFWASSSAMFCGAASCTGADH